MKPENLILLLIAGVGMWYLLRQPAAAEQTAVQRLVDTSAIQERYEAVQRARANLPPLRTAQTGSF